MCRYISIFGCEIPSYGFCMAIAFLLCGALILRRGRKNGIVLEDAIVIMAVSLLTALFGAGLLYIAVSYELDEMLRYIRTGNFSFLTNVGLVFYGGLAGGIAGALVTARILHVKICALCASAVPYVPLGHAIGRIGCLLAGCCYGTQYSGFFAVQNLYANASHTYFPIQATESLLNIIIMFVLIKYSARPRQGFDILYLYLIMYSIVRFFTEFFRGDLIRGIFFGISTSQFISLFILFLCVGAKLFSKYKRRRAVG